MDELRREITETVQGLFSKEFMANRVNSSRDIISAVRQYVWRL